MCCIPKNLPVGSLTRSTDVDLLRLRSVAGGRVLGPTAEPRRHGVSGRRPGSNLQRGSWGTLLLAKEVQPASETQSLEHSTALEQTDEHWRAGCKRRNSSSSSSDNTVINIKNPRIYSPPTALAGTGCIFFICYD